MQETKPSIEKQTKRFRVLLVDDQAIIGESVRQMIGERDNIEFLFCDDPSQAIACAEEFSPTVILQDLIMPDVDGLMLVRYFRANPHTKNIPLVVLSSKEDPSTKAEAFAYGANDYIVKLPDKEELLARIEYHSKGYIGLLERDAAYKKLEESQKKLQSELNEAAQYVKNLLPPPLDNDIQTSWRFIPSTELGGDAFGYHWLDEDHFALYLLDVCGHGVGAALLSISVINVLRSQSLAKADMQDPASVLQALNQAFPMEKNNQMFFTIWYGVFNRRTRQLVYATGGHPPALLFSGDTPESVELLQLKTPGFLIGGDPDATFTSEQTYIGKYNKLFIFSDGVYELHNHEGKLLTLQEFIPFVQESMHTKNEELDFLVKKTKAYIGDAPFVDDYSILAVSFSPS